VDLEVQSAFEDEFSYGKFFKIEFPQLNNYVLETRKGVIDVCCVD
jgi:hypothetical protein